MLIKRFIESLDTDLRDIHLLIEDCEQKIIYHDDLVKTYRGNADDKVIDKIDIDFTNQIIYVFL